MPTIPSALTDALNLAGLAWFLICYFGYGLLSRHGLLGRRNLFTAIQKRRAQWMAMMSARGNRVVDTTLLANLSSGNAFFASTTVIVIGGLAAVFGSSDDLKRLFETLPVVDKASLILWEFKVLVLIALFVIAFFQFAWAFRLTHYTAIMIGATPSPDAEDATACLNHAERTARVAGIAGEYANAGLRTYYFAIAAAGWLLNPVVFLAGTTLVVLILYRREYHSRAFSAISDD